MTPLPRWLPAIGCVLAAWMIHATPATSQTSFHEYPGNPVIPNFAGGGYSLRPCVLYDSTANVFRMWFTAKSYGGPWSIYYAISLDGVSWFTYVRDPVLTGGDAPFEKDGAVYAAVMRDGDQYRMYYNGVSGCCGTAIGLATSPDGITWTKSAANPVLTPDEGQWDSMIGACHALYFDGQQYFLYYEGRLNDFPQLGLARSLDGVNFTKYEANPVIAHGNPGAWDDGGCGAGGMFVADGVFYMYYAGFSTSGGPQSIGLVTSTDGLSWSRYPGNPVLSGGDPASWDWTITSGMPLLKDGVVRMWYTGNSQDAIAWSIGYATAPMAPLTAGVPHAVTALAARVTPNPFLGRTTVECDLPRAGAVRVEVFDVRGRSVAMLANEEHGPGTQRFTWDASGAPVGVYFCRMTSGRASAVQRMVLVK